MPPSTLTIDDALRLALEHVQAGRLPEAESIGRQILDQRPNNAAAMHLLGIIAQAVGNLPLSIELMNRSIAADPAIAEFHHNLGLALLRSGQLEQAIVALGTALRLNPALGPARASLAIAHNNLGKTLRDQGQPDPAIKSFHLAIELDPGLPPAYGNLGVALFDTGQLDQAIELFRKSIALAPADPVLHDKLVYALHFHPQSTAKTIFDEHRLWNERHAKPFAQFMRPHTNDRSPDRRLKIGYVSADFYDHVVGRNLLPLFRHHDRSQFEIVCYANLERPDQTTAIFQSLSDHWREIAAKRDEEIASLIRADQIDILVDLSLHLVGNRLLVFARKPAPVQVTFAGYPGTTGLDAIDYRLTDPYLDPPGSCDGDYSERSLHLPETFWCFEPIEGGPEVNALPAQTNGFVTFGCLNNFCKVNSVTLEAWSKVLKSTPDSRLLLMSPPGAARQRVVDALGVDPKRIEFVDRQPRIKYLELYHRIDLCLDTFPYNGHSTSLDAFWMGVPVVSRSGRSAVSRAGLSQASNLGLADLVGATEAEFVQIAVNLAGDLSRLSDLRRTLRQRMQSSPLMDAPRFARGMEALYRPIWRTWCES